MEDTNWDDQLNPCEGLKIFPDQNKAIEELLAELKERCPAQFILLTDTNGHLVTTLGGQDNPHLVELASLIAGDMAASQEISRLTGQYRNSQLVMREGQKASTFIAEAGPQLILFVQLTRDVPLGWARLLINETGHKIGEIINTPPETGQNTDVGLDKNQLTDAVDKALDSMWNG
jgi:predicted regulator of Ras-like GTPase activity (Roadblock/LC7/MglB family)